VGFFSGIDTHISSTLSAIITKSLFTFISRGSGFKFEDPLLSSPTKFQPENGNSCHSKGYGNFVKDPILI